MTGLLKWIWSGIKSFGTAIVLPFRKVNSSSRLRSVVRWSIHFLCLGGVIVGLWFLNYSLRLDTVLRTPVAWLRAAWLPVLAIQIYAISWVGWWLCRTITSQHKDNPFPDLDRAWRKVESTLTLANIDMTRTPMYLFLGQPTQSTASFFNAGHVTRTIPLTPTDPDAPFHVYANDDAIYVCCEETSLVGRQANMFKTAVALNEGRPSGAGSPGRAASHDFPTEPVSTRHMPVAQDTLQFSTASGPAETVAPFQDGLGQDGSGQGGMAVQTQPAVSAGPGGSTARQIESRAMNLIESNIALLDDPATDAQTDGQPGAEASRVYQPKRKFALPVLANEQEMESTVSRLEHLCELIQRARHPYCPLNGIVVLIPFDATGSEELASHVGMLIEQDLDAISATTMVDAPRIAVLCDIQRVEGCPDLLARFPDEQRHRRLGVKFPRVSACDRDQVSKMIFDGLHWLCQKMVPPLVNRLFQTGRADDAAGNLVDEGNRRLYQFTQAIRDRQVKFERIIRRAFLGNGQRGDLLRGCYFSASGNEAMSEQGFTAGIFSQIDEMQNDVAWTREAIERDNDFRRWTTLGYFSIVSVVVVTLVCIFL